MFLYPNIASLDYRLFKFRLKYLTSMNLFISPHTFHFNSDMATTEVYL